MAVIILTFTTLVTTIFFVGDFVVPPLLNELFGNSVGVRWCGIIYDCTDSGNPTLLQYLASGTPWHDIDIDCALTRLKKGVGLGIIAGFAWILLVTFSRK
ncbi:hypothetical protein [Cupriavidus agavae]|uniref:hypothetical protein n=1 Tax=Cupriavidus agavae TaxID=1001822 RepID=UPI00102BB223|nr:hypothetical protein [Cupriavidus agavae]